ncbi:MAG: MBOAT family O-acyltransferase [Desulfobulbaceae bacterium]
MIFSSVTFLFLFLPVILGLVLLAGTKWRNHVLLAGSLLFYAWGEGGYCLLLIGSLLVNFFLARRLEGTTGPGRKWLLTLGILLNLAPLFVFKYAGFVLANLNAIPGVRLPAGLAHDALHLPVGISFFTFQALSYLVDVYRQVVPAERRLVNCGLYIAMFPQLLAGPIVRYRDLASQLVQRTVSREGLAAGAERFVLGLGKKVLLADPLGVQADRIFLLAAADLSTPAAWLGAVCYTLQLYYDFSGYSDMAIGLGRMFGFVLPENFNYPYISRSIREFWRRWHMSLSAWLRDYLYIPLGGNRGTTTRTLANLLIVFLVCGLWHGANWTFVVWGAWHGLFLVLERLVPLRSQAKVIRAGGWLYATLVVMLGWVVFRSPDLASALRYLGVMAGGGAAEPGLIVSELARDARFRTELLAALIFAAPVYTATRALLTRVAAGAGSAAGEAAAALAQGAFRLLIFVSVAYFAVISIAARAYHPFLYFQF